MHRPPRPEALATRILVTGGSATAGTRLTAFDAALFEAGLHDANLLSISSIVPADATVDRIDDRSAVAAAIEPGAYLPTVYAFAASDEPGDRVHAAVAGARLDTGYGVNVEHHGTNEDPSAVRDTCEAMLAEMASVRDATLTDEIWYRIETAQVPDGGEWTGAVAAMAYTGARAE